MRYTPENITTIQPNEIVVFGSNNLGAHAGGVAKYAKENWGAIDGQPIGLQGDCYGIITTSFTSDIITKEFIELQISLLYSFALVRPDLLFLVTKIGCGIAGYKVEDIASLFQKHHKPNNIILPQEFSI